jgi:predicted PolB exonuclease-like 3'-5' exonuclease
MPIVFDLECVATADAIAAYDPDERTPPASYKSEDAIARWRETDRAAYAKQCTFNPRTSQIVAVGLGYLPRSFNADLAEVLTAERKDESRLIEAVFKVIAGNRESDFREAKAGLVTFNGLGFDLPFILNRAAILGVVIPFRPSDYLKRYTTLPHCDLFAVLSNWGQAQKGDSLHGWAKALGIPVDDATSGADVAAQYAAGDWDAIRAHCRSDIEITAAMYERLVRVGRV